VTLFDDKLLGNKENKLTLLRMIILKDCGFEEEWRWKYWVACTTHLVAIYFPEFKEEIISITEHFNNFAEWQEKIIKLDTENLLNAEAEKWKSVPKEVNRYAMFCLYFFFNNPQLPDSQPTQGYSATSRYILRQIFKNMKSDSKRLNNFQILCLMERMHEELKAKFPRTVPEIQKLVTDIDPKSTTANLNAASQEIINSYVKCHEYKEKLPGYFLFEKLPPKTIKSKHVIISISGFTSQYTKKLQEWRKLNAHFQDTEIFSLHWQSSTVKDVMWGTFKTIGHALSTLTSGPMFRPNYKLEIWHKHYEEAITTGKFLAHVLANVKVFEDCCVSLVGFSLGTVVVAYCLKELEHLKRYDLIYDAFLIGGAANVNDLESFKPQDVVANKLINIYSKHDWLITSVLKMVHWSVKPVGANPIKIKSKKIVNVDKADLIYGLEAHMNYREVLDVILKEMESNEDY